MTAVRVVREQRAGRQGIVLAGEGDDALVVVEAVEARSSGAQSHAETTQGGSQSSGAHSLAGMTKTSMCVLHVTDREGFRQTSTCVLHVTDRERVCRGVSEGRTEPRRKLDESINTVRVLVLLVRRGFGGIWRNHATESMLWGVLDSFQTEGRFGVGFATPGFPRCVTKNEIYGQFTVWGIRKTHRSLSACNPSLEGHLFIPEVTSCTSRVVNNYRVLCTCTGACTGT